ncbi:MAG: Bifunctional (p)ppGpp synthase/hydrolase SpoT [candidate division WS6 bacterium OLB20]|uniref:Bifunctional (P)ppGpp synthase/hydrolase SpoT n=1 Tax=candidate division WS6 bacterium OLB20 TaxID=1617426 RepID=A0A136M0A2_9BACT|nr:MAG: Bifunctional (p)ppGpp synthase/hydrolase SpoT [candidate division WS6 bacterium OLB20]
MNNSPLHELSLEQLESLYREVFDDYPDFTVLDEAYRFAKEAHAGQNRDEGRPYIVHPLRMIIMMYRDYGVKDRLMLMAALLHDVVEDTPVTIGEIRERFGEKTADYVLAMTRTRDASEDERPNDKFEAKKRKFAYFQDAPFKIRQLKLFDLIDNMGDWPLFVEQQHPTAKKFPRWLFEYKTFVIPLAESIGPKYTEPVTQMLSTMKSLGYEPVAGSYEA